MQLGWAAGTSAGGFLFWELFSNSACLALIVHKGWSGCREIPDPALILLYFCGMALVCNVCYTGIVPPQPVGPVLRPAPF